MGSVMSVDSNREQYAYVDPEIQAKKYPYTPGETRLIACVVINKQRYLFNVRGILPEHIPALLPGLERMITERRTIENLTLIADPRIYQPLEVVEVDGAGALYELLEATSKGKKADINVLSIESTKNPYARGIIFKGALEALPGIFPQMQPEHFAALRELRLALARDSQNVLDGLRMVLSRGCLDNLKAFSIAHVAPFKISVLGDLIDDSACALDNLYRALNYAKLNQLEHLGLSFWCKDATESGIAALATHYPKLKTLVIHRIDPAVRSESGMTRVITFIANLLILPVTLLLGILGSLISAFRYASVEEVLQGKMQASKLEQIMIYDWPAYENKPVVAEEEIRTYIRKGFLPALNSIFIADRENITNSSIQKEILAQCQAAVTKLAVYPWNEKYTVLLESLAGGKFPKLTHLYYRLPAKADEESETAYQDKVEGMLKLIRSAVLKRAVPKFEAFFLEGEIPARFADTVRELETALMQWVFKQKLNRARLG